MSERRQLLNKRADEYDAMSCGGGYCASVISGPNTDYRIKQADIIASLTYGADENS